MESRYINYFNECERRKEMKREEVKEVTMDDIEKKFGCKVKIVKEENNGN